MRFLNPKTDFAFKKIFGSEQSKPILRSFLNAMLYEGHDEIQSLEILDPYSVPRLEGMKDTFLDVRAILSDGQRVLIEMQVLNVKGLEKRILYNAAKEYANQLERGTQYELLNPVIALTIADFVFFQEEAMRDTALSRFRLIEKDKLIPYPDGDVELVFVELPKWKIPAVPEQSLADQWIRFLKDAPDLDFIPSDLALVDEIGAAFTIAERSKLTAEEERIIDAKKLFLMSQKAQQEALEHAQIKVVLAEKEAASAKEEAASAKEEAASAKSRAEKLAARLRELGEDPSLD